MENVNALLDRIIKNTIEKVSSQDVLPCSFNSDNDAPFINIIVKITRYKTRYKFIRSFKNFDKNGCVENTIFNPQHL